MFHPIQFLLVIEVFHYFGVFEVRQQPRFFEVQSEAGRSSLHSSLESVLQQPWPALTWSKWGGKDTGLQKRCIYWYDQKVFKRTDIVNIGKSLNPCRSNPKHPTQFKHVWCNWRWFPPTSTNHQPGSHDVFDPSCGIILANRHGRPIRRGFALGEMPRWGQYMAPLRPPGQEFSTQGSSIPMPFSE